MAQSSSRSPSRSASKDAGLSKFTPGKAVAKKLQALQIDPSLPREKQLEMMLSLPDLTNTEILLIKMKHRQEDQALTRRSHK